jgi:hypothetical protein
VAGIILAKCFSSLLAGGGFKGGQVLGKSNATGEEVAERPVYPADVIGSIYGQLGIPSGGTAATSTGHTNLCRARQGRESAHGRAVDGTHLTTATP